MNQSKLTLFTGLLLTVIFCGASFSGLREAKACGGCFVPPDENTLVTGHRMVLSISQKQTRELSLLADELLELIIAGDKHAVQSGK